MTMLAELELAKVLVPGLELFAKGTVILVAVGIVVSSLRRMSAANRYAIWSVGFGLVLMLPLLSLSMPSWGLPGLTIPQSTEALPASSREILTTQNDNVLLSPATGARVDPIALTNKPITDGRTTVLPTQARSWLTVERLKAGVVVLWAIGALALLVRLVFGVVFVHGVSRRAIRNSSGSSNSRRTPVKSRFGIPSTVRVVYSEEVSMPLCWGFFHPIVILPENANSWPSDRRSSVMLHELAHATRCDYAAHIVTQIVCALYWPNPLVWMAAQRAAMERELACDDEAMDAGIRSDVYAGHLLDVVKSLRVATIPAGAIAMARTSSLANRIRRILSSRERTQVSKPGLVLACATALMLALPVVAFDVRGADDRTFEESSVTSNVAADNLSQQGRTVRDRIEQLEDRDPRIRRYAAWALGELESSRGVQPLVRSLRDPDADVRLVSAWALGEIKDERSIDPLIESLDDENDFVREMVVLSLGEIEHSSAIDPLLDAYESHESLAEVVIWALGEIDTRRAHRARRSIFEDIGVRPFDNTEVWAGDWLGWRSPRRSGSFASLAGELKDDDPLVRQNAAWGLGHMDDERSVELLLDALKDEDPAVRAMAIWALDETNPSRRRNVTD